MPTRRDGRCFWLRQAIAPDEEDAPALRGHRRADIAIVGGGYAGLWTAIELKERQPSLDIAIIEADICGGGASGRNTGMVLPQWVKLAALEQLCGRDGAIFLLRASADSVDRIDAFCGRNGIDAGLRRDDWLWAASCEQQIGAWTGAVEGLARHGLAPGRVVDRRDIDSLADLPGLLAGVLWAGTATLHPGLLVRGLRRVAIERGIAIHENSPMIRLDRRRPPIVHTAAGSVTAARAVLTLNAWSAALPELRSAILVIASDDAVTAPMPELLEHCRYRAGPLVTDSQTFVTGFRSTHDHRLNAGVTGGQIGFGGLGGQRFEGRSPREADIRRCIARAAPALAAGPFVDSWCGPIDRTRSGLPLFGGLPTCPDVFYGYGFSGNGIATTPLAGRILASLAVGERDEWSSCGLVRPPEPWLPPEPFKYLGALAVRAAVRRKDRLAYENRFPGPLTRRLSAMAPGGVVTTQLERPQP
jgi:glycine/D-amino acid oxidase-like deaminating enzyme